MREPKTLKDVWKRMREQGGEYVAGRFLIKYGKARIVPDVCTLCGGDLHVVDEGDGSYRRMRGGEASVTCPRCQGELPPMWVVMYETREKALLRMCESCSEQHDCAGPKAECEATIDAIMDILFGGRVERAREVVTVRAYEEVSARSPEPGDDGMLRLRPDDRVALLDKEAPDA